MKTTQNTSPLGGDECGAGGKGDAIPLLAFKDALPLGGVIH